MVPPSVLASMFPAVHTTKNQPARAECGKPAAKRKRPVSSKKLKNGDDAAPTAQGTLMTLIQQRGYNITRMKADDAGYDAVPSALQLASFGTHLVRAVHTSDSALLSELLECGLSPNPCNQFRDSVIDLVCKRANETIFHCLVDHGCDLQTVDGFGRTPLHHACWASSLCRPIVESIVAHDPIQFFIEDKHGQTPLEYVRSDLQAEWIEFLQERADDFWPMGGTQPPQFHCPKEKRPDGTLPDPPNAISVTLAAMVSAGTMTPAQVMEMDEHQRKHFSANNSSGSKNNAQKED